MSVSVYPTPAQNRPETLVNGDSTDEDELAPQEFVCPLTMSVMRDPVMTRYGHNFERDAIYKWIARDTGLCPITRKPLRLSDIITHHSLRSKIQGWQIENNMEVRIAPEFPQGELTRIMGYSSFPSSSENTDDTEHPIDDPTRLREVRSPATTRRRGLLRGILNRYRRR